MTDGGEQSAWVLKLLFFAGLGFIFISVLGPLLAFLGTLLAFAFFGYIGFGIFKFFFGSGEKEAPEAVEEAPEPDNRAKKVLQATEQAVRRSIPVVREGGKRTVHWMGEKARWVSHVVTEAFCGAAVGAILGYLAARSSGDWFTYLALSTALGAFLGAVVGSSRSSGADQAGVGS